MPRIFKAKAEYPALDFMDDEDLMPTVEVAEILGVTRRCVNYWCLDGALKSRNYSFARMIRVADLRAFLEARRD